MTLQTVGRRLLSIPAVLIALPVAVATAPVWVPLAVLVDLASRLKRLPTLRLGLFGVVYLGHEWVGLLAALGLRLLELLGWRRRAEPARRIDPYRRIQAWWAASLLRWAGRLLGVQFDLADLASLPSEGFLVLSRHASMVDAVLPVTVVAERFDRFVHYVIKAELRWLPSVDVFGHRLGNYFVARDGDGDAETAAIERFATAALPGAALVIFPEGTYATEANRHRIRTSIARRGSPQLLNLAEELIHLLPPKPAGSLALLAAQPDHDVVVLGHAGLEGVAQLGGLRRRLPLTDPVTVRWWTHPRAAVPHGPDAQVDWLNDRWRELDAWVASIHRPRSGRR